MPVRASNGWPGADAAAMTAFMDGVASAIESLVGEGPVDRARIGIMGWSATGERVLNQATFSNAPTRHSRRGLATVLRDGRRRTAVLSPRSHLKGKCRP